MSIDQAERVPVPLAVPGSQSSDNAPLSANCENRRRDHRGTCEACGRPLPPRRRSFCTDECWRAQRRRDRRTETPEFAAVCRRMLRALGGRVADSDIAALVELVELANQAEAEAAHAARLLHDKGISWTEIGDALGVTRQAARQRWGNA